MITLPPLPIDMPGHDDDEFQMISANELRARDIEVVRVVLEAAAKVCRNERLMFSDEEWRIRCELADGIEELDFTHD